MKKIKAEIGFNEIGVVFGSFEIDFDTSIIKDELDDNLFGAYYAYGLTSRFDLYGFGGYYLDEEGFAIGAGTRALIAEMGMFKAFGFGQAYYFTGDEIDGYEISMGGVSVWQISDVLKLYGVLQLTPLSDFEYKYETFWRSYKLDMERDDLLAIRAGATYQINSYFLRGEATIIGEKTFTIGIGRLF